MAFVLGALPGIGNNFLMTSVMVALLEHFRERSHLALSVTNASGILGKIAFTLIQIFLFPEIGVDSSNNKGLLQYQAATYAICICGAVALTPLNLHVKDSSEQTVRGRMLDISGLQMLRSPVLYVLASVFLFDGLGGGIPEQHIQQASGVFLLSMLLVFFIALGSLVGSIISCCLSRKEMSRVVSLVLIAIFGILMGVLTLTVEAFEKFEYAISYCLLFGMFAGLRTPLMMRTILLALGEDHLGLTVGLTSFATGLGSIIGDESAGAIVKDHNRVDAAFYLSGLSLLASAAACLLLLKMEAKVNSQAQATMSDTDQEGGSKQEGVRKEASERETEHVS
ncbi:monocarboxylate transporter 12-like [Littorina saxatilis]|uniref:monocarboxylate transporter 12-like n=1 Tax=Littorina saxatilis TaxID=31220 RepID=UPI0038B506B1